MGQGGVITFNLYEFDTGSNTVTTTPWTGNGPYYLRILKDSSDNTGYIYTGGGTAPKTYNISQTLSTIDLSQFKTPN